MPNRKYTAHFKTTLKLAYPVVLIHLGHMMVSVADSVMVGRLGTVPLAGASLANVGFHLLLMFGIGVSYAITPLVAAADGEGDRERSAVYLKHAIVVNLITGILLYVVVLFLSPFLHRFNQPEEVVVQAIPYLHIVTMSLIPFMVFQTFRQFAEGLSDTKIAMIIVMVSNLINIALNYVFIYGKWGFPSLGLPGAGYASLISRVVLAGWVAVYIYRSGRYRAYRAGFVLKRYRASVFKQIVALGLPAGLQFMFEVGAFGFAVIMIGWISTEALAAHQIAVNLAAISYMIASGLSAAATIRVGNQLGRKDIVTLREVAFTAYVTVVVFMAISAAVFIAGRYFLPALYIRDPAVIEMASSLLIIAGFFQLSDGIQVVSLGLLRGLSDVKIPSVLTFVAYWVFALPLGYVLAFEYDQGIIGVWYGLLAGLTLVSVMLFVRFNKLTKKLQKNGKGTNS